MDPESAPSLSFKLVLLGESAVGKTSLVLRFVHGRSDGFLQLPLADGTTVKFDIWDTAGQERYRSLAPMYYRGAHAGIVVYDITSDVSFKKAKGWVTQLKREGPQGIVIALAANKADLDDSRAVNPSDGQDYADENGLLFMETSAKTNQNVKEVFQAIAKKLPKDGIDPEPSPPDVVNPVIGPAGGGAGKKCC